jgi:hypothetical protein
MSKQPQRVQNMQSEFSDVLKHTKLSPLARELPQIQHSVRLFTTGRVIDPDSE